MQIQELKKTQETLPQQQTEEQIKNGNSFKKTKKKTKSQK